MKSWTHDAGYDLGSANYLDLAYYCDTRLFYSTEYVLSITHRICMCLAGSNAVTSECLELRKIRPTSTHMRLDYLDRFSLAA